MKTLVLLADRFSKFLEMGNQLLVVLLIVDVEAIPKVATDDDTSKSQCFCYLDVLQAHASQCIDFLVDESVAGSQFELLQGEVIIPKGDTVLEAGDVMVMNGKN